MTQAMDSDAYLKQSSNDPFNPSPSNTTTTSTAKVQIPTTLREIMERRKLVRSKQQAWVEDSTVIACGAGVENCTIRDVGGNICNHRPSSCQPGQLRPTAPIQLPGWTLSLFYIPTVSSINTLALLEHAELFWCFHNPLNFDKDCRIFNLHMWSVLLAGYAQDLRGFCWVYIEFYSREISGQVQTSLAGNGHPCWA